MSQREVAQHSKDCVQVWRDCTRLRISQQSMLSTPVASLVVPDNGEANELNSLDESICELLKTCASRICAETVSVSGSSWDQIESLNKRIMKYCLGVADEWHEKTKTPNRKNLKALDQSISAQMEYVMNDPDARAVKRCRGVTDEEYDVAPLYAAILKESVQRGASGDEYTAMKMESKFGKKPSTKEVDRRASKGRKIRYSSIEKLVNFMAPRPVPVSEGTPITDEQLVNAFVNSIFH